MATHSSTIDPPWRIRSLRRLLIVAGTMAALTVLAPTVSAAPGGHHDRTIHIEKVCNAEGSSCTITKSNYRPIRPGSTITYEGTSFDALVATVHARHGSASGDCDISPVFAADPGPGRCTFSSGTGTLKRFDVSFVVNFVDLYGDGTSLWFWDGSIATGHGRHH